jgi:hypothetical protein
MPMDIDQDLHDARGLLEQSGTEGEKRKYRKAAEIILLKALHHDPENKEAKALLQSARTVSSVSVVSVPAPQTANQSDAPIAAEPVIFKDILSKTKKKRSALKFPMGLIAVILLGGGLQWMLQSHPASPVTLAAPVQRPERLSHVTFQTPVDDTHDSVSSPAAPMAAVDPNPAPVVNPDMKPVVLPKAIPKATVTEIPRSVPTPPMGTLAVSSPVAADIYQNGQYIASTPATLQLPAGQQTVEYRHADLRTVVTHDIKPNETTAASITFQIAVQINAKPWAQVFLDGAPRRPLGQTPLSGVSLPIGGTLIFENPNFPPKTYRITEKDTAIQLNFP